MCAHPFSILLAEQNPIFSILCHTCEAHRHDMSARFHCSSQYLVSSTMYGENVFTFCERGSLNLSYYYYYRFYTAVLAFHQRLMGWIIHRMRSPHIYCVCLCSFCSPISTTRAIPLSKHNQRVDWLRRCREKRRQTNLIRQAHPLPWIINLSFST